MAEPQTQSSPAAGAAGRASVLDSIFSKVDIAPPTEATSVREFNDATANADKHQGAMMAAALPCLAGSV